MYEKIRLDGYYPIINADCGLLGLMDRLLMNRLLDWKQLPERKPLLLDGARQVGKSYLIEECFGRDYFDRVLKLDFLANPRLADLFENSLNPKDILLNIELELGVDINPSTDLIFFDEIGECPAALMSLKFFAEQCPDFFLCASGFQYWPVGLISGGESRDYRITPHVL